MSEEMRTIGRLAAAAGVNVETVRYYQRIKLMPVPRKEPGGIRHYGEGELQRLHFIKTAQGLGFSLEEIADLVKLDDGTHCADAQRIGTRKLADVRERAGQLARIEKVLMRLLRRCEAAKGAIRCPLIASLQRD